MTTALKLPANLAAFVDAGGRLSVAGRASLDGIIRRLGDLADTQGEAGIDFSAQIAQLVSDLSELQAELDAHEADTSNPHDTTAAQVGADPAGTAAAAVAAHEAAEDPHPQYQRQLIVTGEVPVGLLCLDDGTLITV